MKTLNICYYYKPEGEMDAFNFVGEATEANAKRYAKYAFDYKIPTEDIEGVYSCETEEDANGKEYDIIVKEKK